MNVFNVSIPELNLSNEEAWDFSPEAGCTYALWDPPATRECMQGKWIIVSGASQSNIWTTQLANTLSPRALSTKQDNFSIEGVFTLLIDIIIYDGEVVYKKVIRHPDAKHDKRIGVHSRENDQQSLPAAFAEIARAPKYSGLGEVRITNFFGEYWDHVSMAIQAVNADSQWTDVPVTMTIGIGLWYANSFGCHRTHWCATRPELGELSLDDLVARQTSDMRAAMVGLEEFCSNRANELGCVVLPIDHCTKMLGKIWSRMYEAIKSGMDGHTSKHLRFIDLWTFTFQMPESCLAGHQTPMSTIWTWQLILGGICSSKPAEGRLAIFSGPTCRAEQVHARCKYYYQRGFHFEWECALDEPCSLFAVAAPKDAKAAVVPHTSIVVDIDQQGSALVANTWSTRYRAMFADMESAWAIELGVDVSCIAAAVLLFCAWASRRGQLGPIFGIGYLRGGRDIDDHDLCREVKCVIKSPPAPVCMDKEGKLDSCEFDSDAGDARDLHAQEMIRDQKEKFSFGLARCIASLHVVAGHMYARQALGDVYLFSWGFTWVPWFFMLSGFILFSAEAWRPRDDGALEYVSRRSISIYPLYAVSLLVAFALAKSQCQAPSWEVLVTQALLLQAWIPQFTEGTLQMQCWFLSCLLAYWAAFQPLFSFVARLHLRGTLGLMLVLFLLPWLVVLVPLTAGFDPEWYEEHTFGHTETWVDLAAATLKFHPLCYWHVFVLGMLLGRLRILLTSCTNSKGIRTLLAIAAPLGYAVLGVIFTQEEFRPLAAKLSTRLSILLPLQAAILLGLGGVPGMGTPPLARLFSHLDFLENYSYAVYVLQFIIYHLWPVTEVGPSFFAVLGLAAVASVHLVQKPAESFARNASGKLARKCFINGSPFLLAGLLMLCSTMVPEPECQADLPAMVQVDDHMLDIRLPLRLAGASNGGVLINPSLMYRGEDEGFVVAARLHRREAARSPGRYDGRQATVLTETWHSEIVIGTMSLDSHAWDEWLNSGESSRNSNRGLIASLKTWTGLQTPAGDRWSHLCARSTWMPENATLLRLVVTGPEDPKVFQYSSDLLVAFSSYPPSPNRSSTCSKHQSVSQMYLVSGVDPEVPEQQSRGIRLKCGEENRAEKNWIPFSRDTRLFFVYSITPHTVVEVQPDGSCGEQTYYSHFAPLLRLQAKHPGWAFRCSAQALYIDDPDATPSLKQAHFLALFHVVDVETGRYAHYAYRFSPEPPFEILQVSSQLRLQTARAEDGGAGPAFAFVSSLAIRNRQVIISYTAGDRDSRALVLTLWKLDTLFQHGDHHIAREQNSSLGDCGDAGEDIAEAGQETLSEAAVTEI